MSLVIAVAVLTTAMLGAVVVGALDSWGWFTHWQTYAIAGSWAAFATATGILCAHARTKAGRFNGVLAMLSVTPLWAALGATVLSPEASRLWPIVAGAAVAAAFSTFSALWPTRWAPQLVLDWSLAGIGATIAARGAVRTYRRSAYRVAELKQSMTTDQRQSLRRRLASMRTRVLGGLASDNGAAPTN